MFIPSSNARAVKLWANIAAFAGFLVSLPLVFDSIPARTSSSWKRPHGFPRSAPRYHIGIDGLGLLLVMLTTVIGFPGDPFELERHHDRLKEYYAFFLLLQTGMLGVFMALDFLLFFVFWETVLVPMYFIIAIWGGPRRSVCRHQVHDLHADRQRADVPGHPDPLLPALPRNSRSPASISRT